MITTKPEFNYEQSWALKVASVDAKESQRIRQTLELIPDEVRSVLDAGCGDGRVTMALARGHDVVGVDVSCNALNREARRSRVASVLTALPFRDESFDLVLVSEVIEHIPADVASPGIAGAPANRQKIRANYSTLSRNARGRLGSLSMRVRVSQMGTPQAIR